MKKFVPFIFIAVMTGLLGVKFAFASEAPVASPSQAELQR